MPTKDIPQNMELTGEVIFAKAKDGDEPKGPPKVSLVANSGTPMMLNGFFDPVVIDMTGAKFDKKVTPIIADHDVTKRIGHTTAQSIEPNRIIAEGLVSSSMGIAKGFVEDANNGFPFQVSVGATIVEGVYVEAKESMTVNGKEYKGPLIVAKKSRIRELSITVLGADSNTSAKVAATRKGQTMPFEDFVASLGLDIAALDADQTSKLKAHWEATQKPTDPTPATPPVQATAPAAPTVPAYDPEQHRASLAAETLRVDSITATAVQFDRVKEVTVGDKKLTMVQAKAHAIKEGWTPDQFELHCMRSDLPQQAPAGPGIHIAAQVRDLDNAAISASILKAADGVPARKTHEATGEEWGWETMYSEDVLEASDHASLRNPSLHQIFDLLIIRANGHGYHGNRKTSEFLDATRQAMRKIQAASGGFTTHEATNIFDDAANKLLLAGYQGSNTTWQEWAGVRSVSDFKTSNLYRLTGKGAYQQLGADGELKHGSLTDDKYTHAADTYGKIYGLTRKQLINDDLGAFNTLMTLIGQEGAKSLEEVCYVLLLGQVGTTWVAGNNNLSSGAGSDLTIAGLSAAQQLFEDQVDADNAPIMIEPDRILVGTQDRVQAGQLFNDTDVREGPSSTSTKKEFTRNPHTSAFRPIVSGYLNNTSILQRVTSVGSAIPNQDTNQWFMFGNPAMSQGSTIVVSFLNGNRRPILESADASFDVLGMQWRGYHDFGADVADPKLSVRSAGT